MRKITIDIDKMEITNTGPVSPHEAATAGVNVTINAVLMQAEHYGWESAEDALTEVCVKNVARIPGGASRTGGAMSTVAIEFQNAECPKCGVEALEFFDRYLRTSELVEMCDCGVEPEYERVYCYQAVCDHCGFHVTDYGDWCAIGPTPEAMWECLPDWQHIDGRDLCPSCWWIDDNDQIREVHNGRS